MTDRELILKMWDETWASNTWFPAWTKTFDDLTPEQAAWKPEKGRNSIWQNLNHLAFWHNVVIGRLSGKNPTEQEIAKGNFEEPSKVDSATWSVAKARFDQSWKDLRAAIASEKHPAEKFHYLLPHATYHMGQVMYLRALQGLPAIGYE